jgi:hypothetical protein
MSRFVKTISRVTLLVGVAFLVFLGINNIRTEATSGVNVITYHNDNARTGQNLSETTLTPTNVNESTFGRLFTIPLDGYVYAQPLYASNVTIPGQGVHNMLFVATEHDSAFAFDADTGQQLWYTSFIDPGKGITTVSSSQVGCQDLVPEIGVTGTPVIDPATKTIYMVAKTSENGTIYQRLHALSIFTGLERPGSPVVIQATVPGSGAGSVNGEITFNPLIQHQRISLLYQHGVVEIGWASHCDLGPFHAWVMAYSARTLKKVAVWNSTPNGTWGGVWQSGAGLAADSSYNTFVATGNGTFDENAGQGDYGDTIVKLPPAKSLTVGDYFTPYNQEYLGQNDIDLGSGGVVLLPDNPGGPNAHLLVESGKEGSIYLVNRDNMGKYNSNNNDQIVQFIPYVMGGTFGGPAWWNDSIYFGGSYDAIKQFAFNTSTGLLSTSPVSESGSTFGFPGVTPSISANGNSAAILWAVDASAYQSSGPAVLNAYDATNLASALYSSNQNSERDNPGPAVKFTAPTIANGKVYVNAEYQISVFGLLQ